MRRWLVGIRLPKVPVEAFLVSTAVVALGEIGDKTQLLALVLAARFQRPLPIIAGIFVATMANHSLAGYVGNLIQGAVPVANQDTKPPG